MAAQGQGAALSVVIHVHEEVRPKPTLSSQTAPYSEYASSALCRGCFLKHGPENSFYVFQAVTPSSGLRDVGLVSVKFSSASLEYRRLSPCSQVPFLQFQGNPHRKCLHLQLPCKPVLIHLPSMILS